MRNSIARAIVACLRTILAVLLPAEGKHRTAPVKAAEQPSAAPVAAPWPVTLPRSPYAEYNADPVPLVGEEPPLVRPLVAAYEKALEAQRARVAEQEAQRQRRLAVAAALDGFDIGPDVIHGVRLPLAR
ncbi:hypothetical protein ACFV0C_30475 [Streptomyces sp. NPDC059568]|uniref:hypothetical protein n=1 Tax=Streptomyces sp. NPDC059568 TaxID=3346868 RepID=UPI0036C59CE0